MARAASSSTTSTEALPPSATRRPSTGQPSVRRRWRGSGLRVWSTPTSTRTNRWFVTDADPERFRLGVNYWPAEVAMAWLQAYDPAVTRRDFRRAASAGFDSVRIFLRWEDAQPTPSTIDAATLGRLVDVA